MTSTFTYIPFPMHPDYLEAIRSHNATLDRLRADCTSCSADYLAADRAFTEALKALPDERMQRAASQYRLDDEMPRTREARRT